MPSVFEREYYISDSDQKEDEKEREDKERRQWRESGKDTFLLTQEQRTIMNKKLPRGFALIKTMQCTKNFDLIEKIKYIPTARIPRVASQALTEKFLQNPVLNALLGERTIRPISIEARILQLPQGKSKHAEKIKSILQKFRKINKFSQLSQQLQKLGLLPGLLQIEAENKKNIHTIDSFKDRCLYILEQAKLFTSQESAISLLNEMQEELLYLVEQAKKAEFEAGLSLIQKQINEVTRQITEIREQGNFYVKRKKRPEKNYDEKELLHLAQLIRKLPRCYLVGVMEIIEDKPFSQIVQPTMQFNLAHLKMKKVRQLEQYVKRKLITCNRSRTSKRQKMLRKQRLAQEQKPSQIFPSQNYIAGSMQKIQSLPQNLHFQSELPFEKEEPLDLQFQMFLNPSLHQEKETFGVAFKGQLKSLSQIENQPRFQSFEGQIIPVVYDEENSSDSSMITYEEDSDA